MNRHPIFLDLRDRRVVVIGGGTVAERKIAALLDSGARITVIAPRVTNAIDKWAEAGQIGVELRPYRRSDLRGAALAYVATDDPETGTMVRKEAQAERVWLNVADRPELCDFFVPAVLRRGDLTVAISTNGASPALARRLREQLEARYGDEIVDALEMLKALRERYRAEGRPLAEAREEFEAIIERALAGS